MQPPTIGQQPASQVRCEGAPVSFSVVASGGAVGIDEELHYEWRKNGVTIPQQDGPILTILSVELSDAGQYEVRVSNGCGETNSSPATLTVRVPPIIAQHPAPQSVCFSHDAIFSVLAASAGPLAYEWQKSGQVLSGQTNSTLVLTSVTASNEGNYRVIISDGICPDRVSSNAVLSLHRLGIAEQPKSVGVCGGGPSALSVTATGSFSLAYQWRSNGIPVPGATNATLTGFFEGILPQQFDVIVSNPCLSLTSLTAAVTLTMPLSLPPEEPVSQTACVSKPFGFGLHSLVFGMNNPNAGPLTYQWRKDGIHIPEPWTFFYGKQHASTNDAGTYSCVVSNACGAVTSRTATLTVLIDEVRVAATDPTAIEGQPNSGAFTIFRTETNCGALTVAFALGGEATNGLDYNSPTGSVIIPAGAASATIPVSPIDDPWLEPSKAVVLTLRPSTNYNINSTGQTGTITIVDNDVMGLIISTHRLRVPEAGTAAFTVQLNGAPEPGGANAVEVTTTRTSGDTDLRASPSKVTFKHDNWNDPRAITISADVDADAANGLATFLLSNDRGLSNLTITAVEIDREAPPELLSIFCLTNGLKELHVLGYPGSNYVVEATATLTQPAAAIPWSRISTNSFDAAGFSRFTILDAPAFPQQFFRVGRP